MDDLANWTTTSGKANFIDAVKAIDQARHALGFCECGCGRESVCYFLFSSLVRASSYHAYMPKSVAIINVFQKLKKSK